MTDASDNTIDSDFPTWTELPPRYQNREKQEIEFLGVEIFPRWPQYEEDLCCISNLYSNYFLFNERKVENLMNNILNILMIGLDDSERDIDNARWMVSENGAQFNEIWLIIRDSKLHSVGWSGQAEIILPIDLSKEDFLILLDDVQLVLGKAYRYVEKLDKVFFVFFFFSFFSFA